jgi:hypothetical protein
MRFFSPAATAATVLALSLLAVGCSRKPTPYSRGNRIPIGDYAITVSYTEAVARGSTQTLITHFRCEGVNSREETGKFFVTLSGHMRIIDSSGNEYAALPFTLDYYRSRGLGFLGSGSDFRSYSGSSDLTQWVVAARVPVTAHGFSLRIGNPGRQRGQPRAALIPLGR